LFRRPAGSEARLDRYRFPFAMRRSGDALAFPQKARRRDRPPESIAYYGEAVGLGVDWLAFSLSLAAFAVACLQAFGVGLQPFLRLACSAA